MSHRESPLVPPETILASLDPQQRQAATEFGSPVVIIAGAGTGKTRTITHRIAYGAATGQLDPSRTLAVTFTTKAAGEMKSRLIGLGVGAVQAQTFHATALRIARHFWPRFSGSDFPSVCDDSDELIKEVLARLDLGDATVGEVSNEIGWAKVCNVFPDNYADLAASYGRSTALEPRTIAMCYQAYEQLKHLRGLVDFSDIVLCANGMLLEREDILAEIRRRYCHVVVDEFQDVSAIHNTFLNLVIGPRTDWCVVGDPQQSIHGFAGADPRYLIQRSRDPKTKVIDLTRNYRSTRLIIDLANHVKSLSALSSPKLSSVGDEGVRPEFVHAINDEEEAAATTAWLEKLHAEEVEWKQMGVLYRVKAKGYPLQRALAAAKIPFIVYGQERFFDRAEVKQVFHLLKSVPDVDDVVRGVAAACEQAGWSSDGGSILGFQRRRWESLTAIMDLVKELVAARPEASLAEVIEELNYYRSCGRVPEANAVTLSTLHAAKGLEWDAVCLLGVDDRSLPSSRASSCDQLAEEQRLAYVGVTRARRVLRVSWTQPSSSASRISRYFLQPASGQVTLVRAVPVAAATTQGFAELKCSDCQRSLVTGTEVKLGRHLNCHSSVDQDVKTRLLRWRKQTAQAEQIPEFVLLTDATVQALSERPPRTEAELIQMGIVGLRTLTSYGSQIMEAVTGNS